ncbi:Crp/Fnr family transcriptional regulator [Leeuwenhoekiella palythoae]|uniref:Crp/Fnr family transcriptional regulator n=1 Tax=Leeuwenhoekiella palythoae TaxID=573501 RepID=UPI001CE22753|nr:Crp/Fnr family transcriptional regulator [Leeuwenhoekiella palythoae]UBZ10905.1 Crp/Fnr family transcriptional regulator [Leeuwenhoekiella palythoae]
MNIILDPPKNKYLNFDEFSLFAYLEFKEIQNLENKICTQTFKKGAYIYQPPANQGYVYEIVTGAVKLGSYTETGTEFVHDIIHTGDYFGNLKYLNNQFFEFSKTLVSSTIRMYKLDFFKEIVPQDSFLAEWFMSYLVKRWCQSEKKIKIIKEKDLQHKIKSLRSLYNLPIIDADNETYNLYDLLTQQELGDIAGASRQTISLAQKL